jgi:DedD protein
MAESEDVNMLKRRGRRRLVGAIALVLAAVIVLPMVFDPEPRGSAPPVNVRIPGEDDSAFVPKVTARKAQEKSKPVAEASAKAPEKAPEKTEGKVAEASAEKAAPAAPEVAADRPAPKIEIVVKKAAEKPAPAPAPVAERAKAEPVKPEALKAEMAKAEAALAGEQFIVPAGAYVDPSGVIDRLKAAKIPYYTEPIATKAGTVTRVRAGPFASRDAADRVLQQLKDLGLKPGNVATKS